MDGTGWAGALGFFINCKYCANIIARPPHSTNCASRARVILIDAVKDHPLPLAIAIGFAFALAMAFGFAFALHLLLSIGKVCDFPITPW